MLAAAFDGRDLEAEARRAFRVLISATRLQFFSATKQKLEYLEFCTKPPRTGTATTGPYRRLRTV